MGKRSRGFKRKKQDAYDTPLPAFSSLIPHLTGYDSYYEPCAGKFQLILNLAAAMVWPPECKGASDIKPRHKHVKKLDALKLTKKHLKGADCIITNPPWDRKILHPMIMHLITLAPTFLLIDADWAQNQNSRLLLPYCRKIIPIGRLKWIKNSKHPGKDNCCWYLFENRKGFTQFIPRLEKTKKEKKNGTV